MLKGERRERRGGESEKNNIQIYTHKAYTHTNTQAQRLFEKTRKGKL